MGLIIGLCKYYSQYQVLVKHSLKCETVESVLYYVLHVRHCDDWLELLMPHAGAIGLLPTSNTTTALSTT